MYKQLIDKQLNIEDRSKEQEQYIKLRMLLSTELLILFFASLWSLDCEWYFTFLTKKISFITVFDFFVRNNHYLPLSPSQR
jgi:hypothetical protein